MKRLMAAAFFLSAIGAIGVWFVLPIYAENQFKQSLDAWAASRPGDKAGYAVANLDYWAGRATVGSLTEVIEVEIGERNSVVAVTFTDLAIEGYDFAAAERAALGQSNKGDRIAESVSWGSVSFENESGALKGKGASGAVTGFTAMRVNPTAPLDAEGVSFARFEQTPLEVAHVEETSSLTMTAGPFLITNYTGSGFDTIDLGAMDARFDSAEDEAGKLSWTGFSAGGLVRGEPTTLERMESLDFRIEFNIPGDVAGEGAELGLAAAKGPMIFGWGGYRFEKVRFDETVFDLYRDVLRVLLLPKEERSTEKAAVLVEGAVQLLERAETLQTGAERVSAERITMDLGGVQTAAIERTEAVGVRGLKIKSMIGGLQKQTDALGMVSTVRSTSAKEIDFTALPGYLRKVLGAPVTSESLGKAADFYSAITIADAIPAIDFGVWEVVGQTVVTPDGQEVFFERIALDRFAAKEDGDVSLAFSFDGVGVDLSALPQGADPQADMAVAMLKSQGIEKLSMDMAFDMDFSPSRGEITLKDTGYAIDGIASLDISSNLGGLDLEQLRQLPPEARASMVMSMSIKDAEVNLADMGGRDIAFALLGGGGEAKPEEVAFGLSLQAQQMIGGLGSARAEQIARAVSEFILSGGSLRLQAVPAGPYPMVEYMIKAQSEGPAAVLELLNLEAEYRPLQ